MFKVETYQNPHSYFENIEYKEGELHIGLASLTTTYMKDSLNKGKSKNRVWMFSDFKKAIYPNWNSSINKFKMKVEIRNLLDNKDQNKVIFSMKKDIDKILELFRYLIEIGIKKLSKNKYMSEEKLLIRDLFNEFVDIDIVKQNNELKKIKKEYIINNLNKYYKINYKKDNTDDRKGELLNINQIKELKKIYIYNLSKVDATMYIFFERLQFIGIDLIFRIPYSNKYKTINKPWTQLYKRIKNIDFLNKEQLDDINLYSNQYLNYIEGNDIEYQIKKEIEFKNFIDPVEFKQFIKFNRILQSNEELDDYFKENNIEKEEFKNNYEKRMNWSEEEYSRLYQCARDYLAFSKDSINDFVKLDIIKTNDRITHFFEYPEGKFLKFLYNIKWNDENLIELQYKDFVNCMTSGWITIGGTANERIISGTKSKSFLKDIEPYMNGVKTFKDIKNRLKSLEELNDFSNVFDDFAKTKTGKNRYKKYLSNPLKVLSYTNLNRYDITLKQLMRLTEEFEKIIINLIPKDNFIVVNEHLDKLLNMWTNLDLNFEANQILIKALTKYRETDKFYAIEINEMKELMIILMSLPKLLTFEERKKYNIEDHDNLIKDFGQLMGMLITKTKEIYLTDMSSSSYEKYINNRKTNLYYLDIDDIEKEIEFFSNEKRKEILKKAIEIDKISDKYQKDFVKFYLVYLISFYEEKLHISWIDNLNEDDGESVEYRIIKNLYSKENEVKTILDYDFDNIEDQKREYYEIEKTKFENIPSLNLLDIDYCDKKFYYSSILNSHPIYTEDFHQRMIFSTLAKMFIQENYKKETINYFYNLFPQWNQTLKENLVNTDYTSNGMQNEHRFEEIIYPNNMKRIQILRSIKPKGAKIRKGYEKQSINTNTIINEYIDEYKNKKDIKSKEGKHCMMCPYAMLCGKGGGIID